VKARTIIQNTAWVLGIELMIAVQALEDRQVESSMQLELVKNFVRTKVDRLEGDRYIKDDIDTMQSIILNNELINFLNNNLELN